MIGQLCDRAAYHIDDADDRSAAPSALLERRDGVGCLTGLGDHQHQRVLVHHRLAVAQLAGQLHLNRDMA